MLPTNIFFQKPLLLSFTFLLLFTGCNHSQKHKHTNRLAKESSPYLLQHQHNPVDWYPWGEEAFAKAKKENKPVLLSVGYSTCHWCHVMERESFENEEIAKYLNENFVSIKVDREERPDIDNIYMEFVQRTTGSGGWPMTVFMTPEQEPFFGGTYFPPDSRYGRPGFKQLLNRVAELWNTREKDLREDAGRMREGLKSAPLEKMSGGPKITAEVLTSAFNLYKKSYDSTLGGFGKSPKFPMTHNLSAILRYWKKSQSKEALEIVENTLKHMQRGGIYDHLGGGFHRYSTDREWLVPHFEKMLYDQALITKTYLEAYQITKEPSYAKTCHEVFQYLIRDMTSPEGGFFSAEDADSEGVEGKFYVWNYKDILKILGESDGKLFCKIYQVKKEGNFREEATGEETNLNILHLQKPLSEIAKENNYTLEELEKKLAPMKRKLFQIREKRIHPYKDDKILTDWNGLMISSLAIGGRILNKPEYIEAAKNSASFILTNLYEDGILLHRYRNKVKGIHGFIDDYAFFALGLLDLYEATFEEKWLEASLEISNKMIELFWDQKEKGFFFAESSQNKLISNSKKISDGARPAGNSTATLLLVRLGHLTQNKKLENLAWESVERISAALNHLPTEFSVMLIAIDFYFGPTFEIVFAGSKDSLLNKMHQALYQEFIPNRVLAFHPSGSGGEKIEKLIPFIKNQEPQNEKTTAYICENYACQLPTNEVKKMLSLLRKKK